MTVIDFMNSVVLKNNFPIPKIEKVYDFLFRKEIFNPNSEITIRQSFVIIYLITQSLTGQSLGQSFKDVTGLKDENGNLFLNDLEFIFSIIGEIKELQSILISTRSGIVALEFSDNSMNSYRKRLSEGIKPVDNFSTIRKQFLVELHSWLYQDDPIHANFIKEDNL